MVTLIVGLLYLFLYIFMGSVINYVGPRTFSVGKGFYNLLCNGSVITFNLSFDVFSVYFPFAIYLAINRCKTTPLLVWQRFAKIFMC